ncbi:MAG: AMP-binding protein [Clostridia bacterium]|nr:AMP-binding protein [Clostridia bacterium]
MKSELIHEKHSFVNMRELIEWAAKTYGEAPAYSYRNRPSDKDVVRVSFIGLRDDVRALAASLAKMGCAGKHVALIAKSTYHWMLTYFATLSIGAVLVPLDRDWQAEDLAETCVKAEVKYLITDCDIAEKASFVAARLALDAPIVYIGAPEGTENRIEALVENGRSVFAASPECYFDAPIDPLGMSLLVFTSGTTGKGKGVMLSQNAILADITDAIPYIDYSAKTLGVLPPHHTYGSTVMYVGHAVIGSEIYISSGIRYILKELGEQKPGHLVLVPLYLETFYRRIMGTIKEQGKEKLVKNMIKVSNGLRKVGIDVRKKLFSSIRAAFGGELKTVISGGAPINRDIVEFFDAIGIATLNGYGITECAPLVAVNHSRNIVHGSVGAVIDIDTVKINEPNEDGEGEILVKGPNVMIGYYKDEAASADALTEDGFFRTGDYGKLDENNVLYITGRKKNLIILSNGKNVYPEEIENVLAATPGIVDIIVYEGQSKRGIENNAIVAEIYPDKEYFEKNGIEDIKEYFKARVKEYNATAVPYKKIGHVKVRSEEFPKNTLRKILRFKLDMTIE